MTTSDTVESLGSGIPRILRAYGEDCFKFTDNFVRIILPISNHDHASDHASVHVEKLVSILTGEMGRSEMQGLLSIKNRDYFGRIISYQTEVLAQNLLIPYSLYYLTL